MHVVLPMAKSTQLLLVIAMADASAVPLLVTVTVVAALVASTAVAGKLTGDGDALNAGTRAGIVVTNQFEEVVAELHVNDTRTPSVYDSCGTTSNLSVYGNGVAR